ncbi:hypothetical protein AVEN_142312-1 [Araneus ventricosus]|uniref:Uncharacterized protein n=1 Tax=Araneus ventricosus TaxID=182803 RepID=A0A4Y2R7N8_ARAVE|nr:hypothetical protein AVEN_142312-1 [Araneus ventricosus]
MTTSARALLPSHHLAWKNSTCCLMARCEMKMQVSRKKVQEAATVLKKELQFPNGYEDCFRGLFWYPWLGWETQLFPLLTCGNRDVSQPNRGYQNRPENRG